MVRFSTSELSAASLAEATDTRATAEATDTKEVKRIGGDAFVDEVDCQ